MLDADVLTFTRDDTSVVTHRADYVPDPEPQYYPTEGSAASETREELIGTGWDILTIDGQPEDLGAWISFYETAGYDWFGVFDGCNNGSLWISPWESDRIRVGDQPPYSNTGGGFTDMGCDQYSKIVQLWSPGSFTAEVDGDRATFINAIATVTAQRRDENP